MHDAHQDAPADEAGASWLSGVGTSTESIYGLIIVAGMIVVSRNLTADSGGALLSVVTTLVVFFLAHAYASALSQLARGAGDGATLRTAIRHGLRESSGMVIVGILPIAVLALGVVGLLPEANAVWLALAIDITLLGALGWLVAASRTRSLWVRAASVVLTASFGGVLILLKAVVHH